MGYGPAPRSGSLACGDVPIVRYLPVLVALGRSRVASEEHLVGVAIENQQRREIMREEFGTDIPDRDYVVDEE